MPDDDKNPDDKDKGSADDKAKDPKPEVSFKTKGEFHAEIERKSRPLITKAVEDALKPVFEKLGIESLEDLDGIAEGAKKTKQVLSETDQVKKELDKLKKDNVKLGEKAQSLSGWRTSALKRQALQHYAPKVRDLETLAALLEPKMMVSDEGDEVTGPNGKSLDDFVEDLLKSKAFLKVPEIQEGSGTTGNAVKAKPGAGKPTNGEDKRAPLEKVVADMVEADRARRAATGQA